ncbi:MAG: PEP-CTERM sorting domain-containing protein [Cyanobacteria bacterium SBLK]|nr:PEP-CTERM sorting domain-containing protein [Cyanobacteria bacterium SBLK]
MKNFRAVTLIGSTIAALGLAIAAPANAGQLHNGWNYGIDAFKDGALKHDGSGGEKYNIRGFAFKETEDKIIIGLTGGTSWEGHNHSGAGQGKVGWGDMVLNFSPETNFTEMIEDYGSYTSSQTVYNVKEEHKESLLAIKFAPNDQGGEYGLYSVDSFKGITKENVGYANMDAYNKYLNRGDAQNRAMGTDLPNKTDVTNYFGTDQRILNVVEEGTKIADIAQLDEAALVSEGLEFDHFLDGVPTGGYEQTFGFSIDKSAFEGYLPGGMSEFMAHVFLECANDGVALAGNFTIPDEGGDDPAAVPEPTALLGLSAMGLAFAARKRRQLEA